VLIREKGSSYRGEIPCPSKDGRSEHEGPARDIYVWRLDRATATLALALADGTTYRFEPTREEADPFVG
jgi:hypothetical protein